MNNLVEFLTSKQIIYIYIVAFLACLVCFIIYLVEKNNKKLRLRHNTRELNKLVEEVREEANIIVEKEEEVKQEPILIPMEELQDDVKKQPIREKIIVDQNALKQKKEEELKYTSIEPDQKTAKLELEKLKAELKKQEELKLKEIEKEDKITEEAKVEEIKEKKQNEEKLDHNKIKQKYEEQQEKNAIISLEELVQKSKDLYEANELTQYLDEGNEPISLKELEKRAGKTSKIEETFEIEKAIPKEEITQIEETEPIKKKVILEDFETQKNNNKKFKNSPIISPIYGIEKENKDNNMELENTADYDKLDAEIKKTNEFLMTLKELQKKLD